MVEFCELCVIFLSTPSARRATFNKVHKTNLKYISIHALCEEGDLTRTALLLFLWIFLSTPSARRATLAGRFTSSTVLISIHALCEEGDPRPFRSLPTAANFYPRPLRGGRPAARSWCPPHSYFYPRPLRGGRPSSGISRRQQAHFYPRPLRGGRLQYPKLDDPELIFLSTPSARRATALMDTDALAQMISIHALCEEGDQASLDALHLLNVFLSTPSARRATGGFIAPDGRKLFLSTPSARRATRRVIGGNVNDDISIHALCEEGDPSSL